MPSWASRDSSLARSRDVSLYLSIRTPSSRIDASMAESCEMIRRRDSSQLESSSPSGINRVIFHIRFDSIFDSQLMTMLPRRVAHQGEIVDAFRHHHARQHDIDGEDMAVASDATQLQALPSRIPSFSTMISL